MSSFTRKACQSPPPLHSRSGDKADTSHLEALPYMWEVSWGGSCPGPDAGSSGNVPLRCCWIWQMQAHRKWGQFAGNPGVFNTFFPETLGAKVRRAARVRSRGVKNH